MGKFRYDKPAKGRYVNEREAKQVSRYQSNEIENEFHVRYAPSKDRTVRKGERR
jgi:hypothetical protein